jgi:hypothetical protein
MPPYSLSGKADEGDYYDDESTTAAFGKSSRKLLIAPLLNPKPHPQAERAG